jgi:hypothetical protein
VHKTQQGVVSDHFPLALRTIDGQHLRHLDRAASPRRLQTGMPRFLDRLRLRLLSISPAETSFARRGFQAGSDHVRRHRERVGSSFLEGYHAAIEQDAPEDLKARLEAVELGFRGFAYEGGAMGLALLDALAPWKRNRFQGFLEGAAAAHRYMAHVGAGWAIARLPWLRNRVSGAVARLDPLLKWLAVDGYGFHEGYFHGPERVAKQKLPRGLSGYAIRAFDQGLGRSLWFVEGAEPSRIRAAIDAFVPARQSDLWSGVGLACAYAGGVERGAIGELKRFAGEYALHLAQGAAFAAKARARAGNPAEHTAAACEILCGRSAQVAAQATDRALDELPPDGEVPQYELWRQKIRMLLAVEPVYA